VGLHRATFGSDCKTRLVFGAQVRNRQALCSAAAAARGWSRCIAPAFAGLCLTKEALALEVWGGFSLLLLEVGRFVQFLPCRKQTPAF